MRLLLGQRGGVGRAGDDGDARRQTPDGRVVEQVGQLDGLRGQVRQLLVHAVHDGDEVHGRGARGEHRVVDAKVVLGLELELGPDDVKDGSLVGRLGLAAGCQAVSPNGLVVACLLVRKGAALQAGLQLGARQLAERRLGHVLGAQRHDAGAGARVQAHDTGNISLRLKPRRIVRLVVRRQVENGHDLGVHRGVARAEAAKVARRHVGDLGLLQRGIELVRQVLDAVDVDHLLGAAVEVHAALAVNVGQIAGPEPAVAGKRLGRRRLVVVVPLEQGVAAQLQASALAGRRHARAVETADAHVQAGHTLAERGKLELLGVVPAGALRVEDAPGTRLGHAKRRLEHVGGRPVPAEEGLQGSADLDDVGLAARVEEQGLEVEILVQVVRLAGLKLAAQLGEQKVGRKSARHAVAADEVQQVGRLDEHVGGGHLDLRDARHNGKDVAVDEVGDVVHVDPREEGALGEPEVGRLGLAAEGSEELAVRERHCFGVAAASRRQHEGDHIGGGRLEGRARRGNGWLELNVLNDTRLDALLVVRLLLKGLEQGAAGQAERPVEGAVQVAQVLLPVTLVLAEHGRAGDGGDAASQQDGPVPDDAFQRIVKVDKDDSAGLGEGELVELGGVVLGHVEQLLVRQEVRRGCGLASVGGRVRKDALGGLGGLSQGIDNVVKGVLP